MSSTVAEPTTKPKEPAKRPSIRGKKKKSIWARQVQRVHYSSPRQRRKQRKLQADEAGSGEAKRRRGRPRSSPGLTETEASQQKNSTVEQNASPKLRMSEKQPKDVSKQLETTNDTLTSRKRPLGKPLLTEKLAKRSKQNLGLKRSQEPVEKSIDTTLRATRNGTNGDKAASNHDLTVSRYPIRGKNVSNHEKRTTGTAAVPVDDLEAEHFAAIGNALTRAGNSEKQKQRGSIGHASKPKRQSKTPVKRTAIRSSSNQKDASTNNTAVSPIVANATNDSENDSSIGSEAPRLAKLPCNSLKLIRIKKRKFEVGDSVTTASNAQDDSGTLQINEYRGNRDRDLTSQSNNRYEVHPTRSRSTLKDIANERGNMAETYTSRMPAPAALPRRFDTNRNKDGPGDTFCSSKPSMETADVSNGRADSRFELFPKSQVMQFGPRQGGDARGALAARPNDAFAATRLFMRSADHSKPLGAVGVIEVRANSTKVPHPSRKPTVFSVMVADNLQVIVDSRQTQVHAGDYFFVGSETRLGFVNGSNREALLSYAQFTGDANCYVLPASPSNCAEHNRLDAPPAPAHAAAAAPPLVPFKRGYAPARGTAVGIERSLRM